MDSVVALIIYRQLMKILQRSRSESNNTSTITWEKMDD